MPTGVAAAAAGALLVKNDAEPVVVTLVKAGSAYATPVAIEFGILSYLWVEVCRGFTIPLSYLQSSAPGSRS